RRPVQRRVCTNAATVTGGRLDAAVAIPDVDALAALFADEVKVVDHTTRGTHRPPGRLASYRPPLGAPDPQVHSEPLATPGDCLSLCRLSVSASGTAGRTLDVGPYEKEEVHLVEVETEGRYRSSEVFAVDRLGDAITRLYERYAELLPDGPARARAAAVARS